MDTMKKGMRVWWNTAHTPVSGDGAGVLATRKSLGRQQGSDGEWRQGSLAKDYDPSSGCTRVCCDDGQVVEVAVVEPANPGVMEKVDDLTELSFLNEPGILHVLKERYDDSMLYTHAGPVLVAVNPFRDVDALYSKEQVNKYVKRPAMGHHADSDEYVAHIFLTADKAFKEMKISGMNQSILITGESGAGKTETTKFVMKYVAGLAGGLGMEHRVLETNPILEAFGNAKTLHNNNSSRFGKLIDIHFDESYRICGASIETYLLEKSRVVHQLKGERNYHIFYQLIRGASQEIKDACKIPDNPASVFSYLNKSGCDVIDKVDDAGNFHLVCDAMADIGIGEEKQMGFWQTLSAILWLGNVRFEALTDDSVSVVDDEALEHTAMLLGVSKACLAGALSTRKMCVGGDVIMKELNIETAQDVRDALAKFLYEAQFRDLIHLVNDALRGKDGQSAVSKLSLLDIYGFECFKENSFEQLCINYANERLQQQFAAHLFKLEQAMYEEEGVDWKYVEFEDNQACVDLIESKPPQGLGLLTLLDEECLFPKGTDASFSEKVCKTHSGHGKFSFNANKPGDAFTIHHYAGPVSYSSQHFLDKNRDTLNPDLMNLVQSSQSRFVSMLSGHMGVGAPKGGRSASVGSRFREQLKVLLERLDQSQLHFVRCIKPNAMQKPECFDQSLVLHQLKCCGILEVARIARAGYPTRYSHNDFAERYKTFLPVSARERESMKPLDICTALLDHFGIDQSQFQIGKTKLFFRAGVLGHLEDHVLRATDACLTIQSVTRMYQCRQPFLHMRQASINIQACWRAHEAQLAFIELKKRHVAACHIQSVYKAHKMRGEFQEKLHAARCLQIWWRQTLLRSKIAERIAAFNAEEERQQREKQMMEQKIQEEERQDASMADLGAEFNMSLDEMRDILQKYTSGVLIVAQPREPDSALQELQRINVELQKELEELKDENNILIDQQAKQLSAKKHARVVAITANASDMDSPRSQESVSIMSYSDTETDNGSNLQSAKQELSFGRAGPQGAVAALNAELAKKGPLFNDDAAFIREVHEGVSLAPNMDPDYEIKRLLVRYKTWHRDFKNRLKATQASLRKGASASPAPTYMNSSAKPLEDALPKKPVAQGLSRTFKNLTRVGKSAKNTM